MYNNWYITGAGKEDWLQFLAVYLLEGLQPPLLLSKTEVRTFWSAKLIWIIVNLPVPTSQKTLRLHYKH
jgi:hypothetical protein